MFLQYEDDDEDEQDADKLAGMQTSLKQRQRQEQDDQLFPDEVRALELRQLPQAKGARHPLHCSSPTHLVLACSSCTLLRFASSTRAGLLTTKKHLTNKNQPSTPVWPSAPQVDTPDGVPARQRFDKYRGLKSFRTAPWDPRESLPQDYSRVFAFENFRRWAFLMLQRAECCMPASSHQIAMGVQVLLQLLFKCQQLSMPHDALFRYCCLCRAHKRAIELSVKAGAAGNEHGVPAGTYVQLRVAAVPADAAARVLQRVASSQQEAVPPLVVFGLLQHECKLSVQVCRLPATVEVECWTGAGGVWSTAWLDCR